MGGLGWVGLGEEKWTHVHLCDDHTCTRTCTSRDTQSVEARLTWPGGEYDERLQVADDETGEQHEAQLAPGRLDDGRSRPW